MEVRAPAPQFRNIFQQTGHSSAKRMRDGAANNNRGASMKDAVKMLFIATGLTAIPVMTASVALLMASVAYELPGSLETLSYRAKEQSGTLPVIRSSEQDDEDVMIELAQAAGLPPATMGEPRRMPRPSGANPMNFNDPMRPDGWIESPKAECQEKVERYAAIAGFLRNKFRLQGSQKQAWKKIEEAAQPALESIHELCTQLPDSMAGPPSTPDMLDFVEQQLSARAAVLRAIRGPVRAFYDSLSPEQRAVLQPSPVGRL
jgi:LTXXQ motif family protein